MKENVGVRKGRRYAHAHVNVRRNVREADVDAHVGVHESATVNAQLKHNTPSEVRN